MNGAGFFRYALQIKLRRPNCSSSSPASFEEKEEDWRRMDNGESSSTNNSSRPWESYNTVFTNAKAGMEGVDKEKVQRIVYEMSKGSKYFQNEERKEALMKQKIEHMRDRCAKLSSLDLSNYQKVVDKRILELEATRDLSRIWLHVDMDAFYAAVETLSDPSIKGKPMAVGGLSMISTANYEARKFGVRAAMPGFIARKLCPDLIFVPVDFIKYTHYSDLTRKVFRNYDPHFIAGSLDEAYLDITEVCRERGLSGGEIAEELRSSVYSETGLTCSAGVAANRLLAKVCSDINKPNGQFVLQNDRSTVMTFVSSLPVRKIGGIGKVTEHILKDALGIKTCEEMVQKGSLLYALFSQSSADFFLSVGLGLGGTNTPQVRSRKSISSERTFAATGDERLLYSKLAELAEMLSHDMKKEGLTARTLTLKLKTASFEIRSRAVSLQRYTCSSDDILKHATKLLKAELPVSVRLIGLRMSQFVEEIRNSDPSQGTITKFIVQKDSSRQAQDLDDNDSFDLDANKNCLSNDESGNVSFGSHETSSAHLKNVVEYEERSQIDSGKVIPNQECMKKEERLQILEGDSLLKKHKECKPDTSHLMNDNSNAQNTEAVSVFPQTEPLYWIDGYKCVLCGIELPPSFVEERQEHSDFHLAQRLQNEETGSSSSTTPSKRRSADSNILKPTPFSVMFLTSLCFSLKVS
ncbi:UmuC domain [Arabidopsis thaliana x Arabidopsis arenosa]|uniref:DNA polymerase kappa n=1 Tax=Arabidopsis thaliana x Arabidopsis arenosa TaxID=1240361 RepID=A0A8T2GNX1_9BRAS|nr:UmuC domain [Arabidopsis thaliana x Arabidopsis arenosa]